MPDYCRSIRRVAVLGAGVMGAQIAAHMANAGREVYLFELPGEGKDAAGPARRAIAALGKAKPAPLALAEYAGRIQAADYDHHLAKLRDCDLVIEAISERPDWKRDLYQMVAPHLGEETILASNTSGLCIADLAAFLPPGRRPYFCGMHFFNPPRYMKLLELIPHAGTAPEILERLEGFCVSALGKGVIIARDTPSFIANRIGMFAILSVIHHALRLNLPLDLVDRLTGPGIGRPKSATFRTLDVVGLDTFAHVANDMHIALQQDPWRALFKVPDFLQGLIDQGHLGQKSGQGIYHKRGRSLEVLEVETGKYRPVRSSLDDAVRRLLQTRDPAEKYTQLMTLQHPQAEFLRAVLFDLLHYSAVQLGDIADSARDLDLAMRWGFGWRFGPLEAWQAAGWQQVADDLQQAIEQGRTISDTPLPDWVLGRDKVHDKQGSWSVQQQSYVPPSSHPVYRRQPWREGVLGEALPTRQTIYKNEAVHLWHGGDDIAVLSFRTKMNTVTDQVLNGILQAVATAQADHQGLILWQPQAPFCPGANLKMVLDLLRDHGMDAVREVVCLFQQASLALKHSPIPTVAAVQGLVLGGGCELAMHCDRIVAAQETYMGLVEAGVGLVPAGGGCKEMALRVAQQYRPAEQNGRIAEVFERIAMAKVSSSADEARRWGYLRQADSIVMNPQELLHVARVQLNALAQSNYCPPMAEQTLAVTGDSAVANLYAMIANLRLGGFASEHDALVAEHIAAILCGSGLATQSKVSESWLLAREVEAFCELLATDSTRARIGHTLATGKPLRN